MSSFTDDQLDPLFKFRDIAAKKLSRGLRKGIIVHIIWKHNLYTL